MGAWAPAPNYMSQRASLSRKTFFPGPGQRVGTAAGAGKVWDPGGLFTCVRTGSPSPFLAPADGGRDWGFGGAAALGGASLWAEPGVCSWPGSAAGPPLAPGRVWALWDRWAAAAYRRGRAFRVRPVRPADLELGLLFMSPRTRTTICSFPFVFVFASAYAHPVSSAQL